MNFVSRMIQTNFGLYCLQYSNPSFNASVNGQNTSTFRPLILASDLLESLIMEKFEI